MKIKFTDDRINEYYNGGFHAKNDGTPIEVSNADVAKDLLAATHLLDDEYVPVFEEVTATDESGDEAPGEESSDSADETSGDDETEKDSQGAANPSDSQTDSEATPDKPTGRRSGRR